MMTPAKRFIVRTSLVTGSTLATLIGAQSLASLPALSTLPTPSTEQITTVNAVESAPHVTIIRRAAAPTLGITPQHTTTTNSLSSGGFQIQPPVPVMVQPVQIPTHPRSRSTR